MDLVRGQRAKLSDLTRSSRLSIGIELEGLDPAQVACVAMLLGEGQQAISPSAVVIPERPQSECGGVSLRTRTGNHVFFDLDLSRVSPAANHLLFAVGMRGSSRGSPGLARNLRRGHWSIETSNNLLAQYSFTGGDFGDDGAIAVGELYRKNGEWRLRAIGDGFVGGLPAMLSRYRVAPGPSSGAPPTPSPPAAGTRLSVPTSWPGGKTPSVPRDLTRAIGLIVARTQQGTAHTGTGFIISPGGHFLTCHHVVEDATELSICLEGTGILRRAEVIAKDPQSDLALCWICDRNGCPDWLLLAKQDTSPTLGDDLGLLGFPLGLDLGLSVTYSQGIVNSLRRTGSVSVLQIDVGAAPGSSGGPVFRRGDGRVVGVLTSGLDVQERGMLINFAVDIRMISHLNWLA